LLIRQDSGARDKDTRRCQSVIASIIRKSRNCAHYRSIERGGSHKSRGGMPFPQSILAPCTHGLPFHRKSL
jgi:hypothetical protein